MGFTMIKFPEMRNELIEYLKDLSDLHYQRQCWLNQNCPDGVEYDELDYSVHFLFDDTDLASDARGYIGVILRNQQEAEVVTEVCLQLSDIFKKYGTEMSDAQYLECPEWAMVLSTAKTAFLVMSESD
jgi:hypothetical protein